MKVSDLKRLLQILEDNDLDSEYIETAHDVIFIPIENEEDINSTDMIELVELGVLYSEDYGCYICFT